ncbi:hypothetical protein KFL_004190010 [Klebsormidium nitens]|uniref:Uncharacterized protein n=1 Tax=Klebsormidium nitens TaxID=105231 RepID=A0A1Y1IBN8_KLENI|nr:hypothetical protein KFL_004190010 [Klebsormidium nitens]|eukprot:GAQ88330.1 hypothetical protein KFL_004190010 [Klebsormidium nitens]
MLRRICCVILALVLLLSSLLPGARFPHCSAQIPLASASFPLSSESTAPVRFSTETPPLRSHARNLLHEESNPLDDVSDDVSHGAEGFVGFVEGASRPDPLWGFYEYKGGFDVHSAHYWASAAFTGIWGYAIGAVWLCVGVCLALYFLFRSCCRKSSKRNGRNGRNGKSELNGGSGGIYVEKPVVTKARTLLLGFIWAVAIAGGVLAVVGTGWVANEVDRAEETARGTAQDAVRAAETISSVLEDLPSSIQSLNFAPDTTILAHQASAFNRSAVTIFRSGDRFCSRVHGSVTAARIVTGVLLSALLLTSAILLTWLCVTRPRAAWLLLVAAICAWIVAALMWVAFGLSLAGRHVADDACSAAEEYVSGTESPSRASLERLFACSRSKTALKFLTEGKRLTSQLVSEYNGFVRDQNGRIGGSHVAPLCDPFAAAGAGCVTLANAAAMLGEGGGASRGVLNQTVGHVSVGDLLRVGAALQEDIPTLEAVANCTIITRILQSFVADRCPPLKTAAVIQWVGYLVLTLATSSLALFSLFLYLLTRRRGRERARQLQLQKTWAIGVPPRAYPGPPRGSQGGWINRAGAQPPPRGGWGSEEDAGVPAGNGTPSAPPLSMLRNGTPSRASTHTGRTYQPGVVIGVPALGSSFGATRW